MRGSETFPAKRTSVIAIRETIFKLVSRLLRLPRSDLTTHFEVLRDSVLEEPQFAESLRDLFGHCPTVLRAYIFNANVNEAADVLACGISFSGKPSFDALRGVDALWTTETKGQRLLAILPLDFEMENQVSKISAPFFSR
jgi:hypothetical protein